MSALIKQRDPHRFEFRVGSLFDLNSRLWGKFDLIVITGVLYPQYIGNGFSVIRQIIDDLLRDGGVLAATQISEWSPWRFPFALVASDLSKYGEYTHRTEIFLKINSLITSKIQ